MGHGGGANFASLGALCEVVKGDVAPDVACKVNAYGVDAGDGIEQFGHVVVGFNLDGVGVEGEA